MIETVEVEGFNQAVVRPVSRLLNVVPADLEDLLREIELEAAKNENSNA